MLLSRAWALPALQQTSVAIPTRDPIFYRQSSQLNTTFAHLMRHVDPTLPFGASLPTDDLQPALPSIVTKPQGLTLGYTPLPSDTNPTIYPTHSSCPYLGQKDSSRSSPGPIAEVSHVPTHLRTDDPICGRQNCGSLYAAKKRTTSFYLLCYSQVDRGVTICRAVP